jgi:hypothetical protein
MRANKHSPFSGSPHKDAYSKYVTEHCPYSFTLYRDEYSRVHVGEEDLASIMEGNYTVHSPDYIGEFF